MPAQTPLSDPVSCFVCGEPVLLADAVRYSMIHTYFFHEKCEKVLEKLGHILTSPIEGCKVWSKQKTDDWKTHNELRF